MRETLAAAARVGLTRDSARRRHAHDARRQHEPRAGVVQAGAARHADRSRVEPRGARHSAGDGAARIARPHLHVAHTSTAAALAAVRQARRNGLRVTCEVAPHHFLLTEEHVGALQHPRQDESAAALGSRPRRHDRGHSRRRGGRHRHRSRAARAARKRSRVRAGAERHHRPGNRAGPQPALAAQGVEDAAGPRAEPAERATRGAARPERAAARWPWAAMPTWWSSIRKAEWTYRATESKSKAKNTPFDGWQMLGSVRWTISEGRIAYVCPEESRDLLPG